MLYNPSIYIMLGSVFYTPTPTPQIQSTVDCYIFWLGVTLDSVLITTEHFSTWFWFKLWTRIRHILIFRLFSTEMITIVFRILTGLDLNLLFVTMCSKPQTTCR